MAKKTTRDEWLDWFQETRAGVASLPDSDPRRADLLAVFNDFEAIEKKWTEVEQHDPELAERLAAEIARILKG